MSRLNTTYKSIHSDTFPPYTHKHPYWSNPLRHWCSYLHATTYTHFATLHQSCLHSIPTQRLCTTLHYCLQIYMSRLNTTYKSIHSDTFPPYTHKHPYWSNPLRHWCSYLHATTYTHFATLHQSCLHSIPTQRLCTTLH